MFLNVTALNRKELGCIMFPSDCGLDYTLKLSNTDAAINRYYI